MCRITRNLRKRSFKPTSNSFINIEKINNTVDNISKILEENNSNVVSKKNQRKIRTIISRMYAIDAHQGELNA